MSLLSWLLEWCLARDFEDLKRNLEDREDLYSDSFIPFFVSLVSSPLEGLASLGTCSLLN